MAKDPIIVDYRSGGNGDKTPDQIPGDAQHVSVATLPGLASLIIPCCGMLEYTQLCVPSILMHTREPFELIFLDIGSLDGTAEYLAGIRAAAKVRVDVVRTATDLGIKVAVTEALARARGEYVVLLNNDTVVAHGWLNQLVGVAATSPEIGLVGPMSNYAAVPQLVETVPYRIGPRKSPQGGEDDVLVDVEAVNRFAQDFREEHKKKCFKVDRLGGFCLLIKRIVLKKIENTIALRDWTDLRLFDTDILGTKARQAGFQLACCGDLFVHHFGTRTFAHGAPKAEEAKA